MPDFQKPKAKKLQEEAIELYRLAETATEPEKSALIQQATAKEHEADAAENGR